MIADLVKKMFTVLHSEFPNANIKIVFEQGAERHHLSAVVRRFGAELEFHTTMSAELCGQETVDAHIEGMLESDIRRTLSEMETDRPLSLAALRR